MNRWPSRVRRAASLLLGVHLLQIVLLAASVVCELNGTAAQQTATAQHAVAQTAAAHPTSGEHDTHTSHGAHDVAGTLPHDGSAPPAHHHAPRDVGSCPMAMACTVTAVVARVPAIETHVVTIATNDVAHVSDAPASTRRAPEPPPPRA